MGNLNGMEGLGRPALYAIALIGAIMVVVWIARIRTKGTTAYLMATAFACLSGAALGVANDAPTWIVTLAGIGLVGCLVADVFVRAGRQPT